MAILRAGPWGNITNSFQNVPSDVTADELTLYPVNCAKTDWLSGQAWGAYYEVVESDGCNGPATITATSFLSGTQQLTKQPGDGCSYYWANPFGPFYGELLIDYIEETGVWFYQQTYSLAPFGADTTGGSDPDDPTGTYTAGSYSYTVTTP
jgi:hypothetical protein